LYTGLIFPLIVAKYQKGTIINKTVIKPKKYETIGDILFLFRHIKINMEFKIDYILDSILEENIDKQIESNTDLDLEYLLNQYIKKLYIKFEDYDREKNRKIFKHVSTEPYNENINMFSLYSLYIMDAIDEEFKKDIFFDQEYGYAPIKSKHSDGNHYMSVNEIHAVLEELQIKPTKSTISRHIISRIRVLSIMNIWNYKIDCDTLIFKGKESENFKKEFKKYLFDNPKYLRYSHLLKVALDSAKMFEHPDPLPRSMKEFKEFLKNPLVYVIFEPYNHINKKENNEDITTGYIIDDEIIIHKI
jgi:hypothetical protein